VSHEIHKPLNSLQLNNLNYSELFQITTIAERPVRRVVGKTMHIHYPVTLTLDSYRCL